MKADKNTENQNTKRRSTFAILFYINRTKVRKDGMCQLLCKVSIDAEWEQIGTKVSVNPAIWNPEKGRADGRCEHQSGKLYRGKMQHHRALCRRFYCRFRHKAY